MSAIRDRQLADEPKESNDFLSGASDFDCAKLAILRTDNRAEEEPENKAEAPDESNDFGLNDLADLCQHSVEMGEENPSLFICSDLSDSRGRLIPYEYQVHFKEDAPIEEALEELESYMLLYLADKMDLNNCDAAGQPVERRRLMRRSLQRRRDQEDTEIGNDMSALIGLSSKPPDVIEFFDCAQAYLSVLTTCKNVNGKVVAYFDAETDDVTMSDYADEIVKQLHVGMNSDVFISDSARLVSYVPTKTVPIPEIPVPQEIPVPNVGAVEAGAEKDGGVAVTGGGDTDLFSTLGYALIGVGCAVMVILSVIFYKKRRAAPVVAESHSNDHATFAESEIDVNSTHPGVEVKITDSHPDLITIEASECTPIQHAEDETPKDSISQPMLGLASSSAQQMQSSNNAISSNAASDEYTVTTQESGVTLEFDMTRTYSTVSELTWYGPGPSSTPTPQDQNPSALAGITEEDEEEEEDDDEDPLRLVVSVDHSSKSSSTFSNRIV